MRKTQRSGFTLVELLVVIAIIVLMAAAVASSSSKVQREFGFGVQYNAVLQIMRETRNLAMSNQTVLDTTDFDADGKTTDYVLPLGYGIKLDKVASPQTLTLFIDVPGTVKGEFNAAGTPSDKIIRKIEVDDRFSIDLDEDGAKVNQLLLYYEPPFGFTNFSGTYSFAHVIVTDKIDSTLQRKILVHRVAGVPEVY